jgi:hypothetical protein
VGRQKSYRRIFPADRALYLCIRLREFDLSEVNPRSSYFQSSREYESYDSTGQTKLSFYRYEIITFNHFKMVNPDPRQQNSHQQNSLSTCREVRFEAVQLSVLFMKGLSRQIHVGLIDV